MKLYQSPLSRRALMAALLAGSGILAASAFANSGGETAARPGCEFKHGQQSHDSRTEHRAMHLAQLKDKLKLQPEQEAAWNSFANAAHPTMEKTEMHHQAWHEDLGKLNTPERLDKMLALSDMRRAQMLERAQAIKAFYAQLTAEQQHIFDAEAMPRSRAGHRHSPQHLRHQS